VIETLWQDLKFALRMLRKNAGFTAVAMLTLALGIGANTAIFSVVNAVLLRPLPYGDAHQLLAISQTDRASGTTGVPVSFTKFTEISEQNKSLASVAAFYPYTPSLVSEHEPELVNAARVSADLFRVLGITPLLGRSFLPEEETPGGNDVAILSNGFWHSHFAADPGLFGKTLSLDGERVTVVGVLPASFHFPLQFPEPDVWLPRVSESNFLTPQQIHSGAGYLSVIARMRPGETLSRAQAELSAIDGRYREQFGSYVDATKYSLAATSLEEGLVGPLRASLLVLLAAVGFVLLIACANVANLLLARATSRDREIGIRKALGATRSRLVQQLLSESLLLALSGGALGTLLASALMPALRALSPGTVPRLAEASIDASVLLFSLLLCALTGVLFGLMPSLQAAGKDLQEALKEGSRGSSEGGHRARFRAFLVVAEIGMALVLMTCAGLLIESFARLMHVNPGLSPNNVMTFPVTLPPVRYPQAQQQEAFYRQLLDHVRTIPGVQAAGATSYLPLSGSARFGFFCPEGHACLGVGKDPVIATRQVSPGYFDTVRTPLLRGRVFTEKDIAGGLPVVVVNQTTATRYWPGQDAVGKHLANSRDRVQREIVGVVADVKFGGLNAANTEEMYLPMAQAPWPTMTLVVRSSVNPQPLVTAVRAKIAESDPDLPVTGILSMEEVVRTSVAQPRIIMQFVGVFAAFALLLAAIGIYGVMAYSVTARKQELGIRVALGARPADILGLVVGQGMRMTLIGVVLGVVFSLALTRLLAGLLFGVRATDPLVFGAAALVLVAVAFVACYIPARRATHVDPIVVLRYE
jgi:putative ABC transport system permease protein